MPAVAFCVTMNIIRTLNHFIAVLSAVIRDALRFVSLGVRSNSVIWAENLILRRQLALFAERKVKAGCADDGTRLKEWKDHCNRGRSHSSLGPGIPDADADMPVGAPSRHEFSRDHRVVAKSVLGGLHHEYRLEKAAALKSRCCLFGLGDIFAEHSGHRNIFLSFSEEAMKGSYFMGCARKCASVSSATIFGCSSTMK
jgi:hypothetical protein